MNIEDNQAAKLSTGIRDDLFSRCKM